MNTIARNLALTALALGTLALNADATTLTQSTSQSIVSGNSVSCNSGGLHTDNSYYRSFTLADFGLSAPFNISDISFGIELAVGATGSQPVQVNIYNTTNLLSLGAAIGTQNLNIADQSLSIFSTPITANVTGSGFTVEIFTPNGQAAGNSFFIGSNSAGQSAPGYIKAPDCGVPNPTNITNIGFPNMHIVMNVMGTPGSAAVPEPGSVALLFGAGVGGLMLRRRKK